MPECRTRPMGGLNSDGLSLRHGRKGGITSAGADAPSLNHQSPPGPAGTAVMDSSKSDGDESDFSSFSDLNLLTFEDCIMG